MKSDDVNQYLQQISGQPFTAKDFRTWAATAQAIALLGVLEPHVTTGKPTATALNMIVKQIAEAMGHTPAICRKCYIYPGVIDAYSEGTLQTWYQKHHRLPDHHLVSKFLALH